MRYPQDGRFQISLGKVGWVDQMTVLPPHEAHVYFNDQLKEKPNDVELRLGRALLHLHDKKYNEAERELDALIEDSPDHFWAHIARGRLRLERGNHTTATDDFSAAIATAPDNIQGYLYRGLAWRQRGDLDKALADHDTAVNKDDQNAAAFYQRGHTHHAARRYGDAISDFEQAIALDPEYTDAYLALGGAHLKSGSPESAHVAFDIAVALEWYNANAYTARGEVFLKRGNPGGGLQELSYSLRLRPQSRHAQRVVAMCLVEQGQYDRALQRLGVIGVSNRDGELLAYRGVAFREKDELDKALIDLDRAVELEPDFAFAFGYRGLVHQAQKKQKLAMDDLTFAINNATRHQNKHLKRWLQARAQLWQEQGLSSKAQQDLDRAATLAIP